jgi:hypothetical protein
VDARVKIKCDRAIRGDLHNVRVRGTKSGDVRQTCSVGPSSCGMTTQTIRLDWAPGSDCKRVHHHGQLGEPLPQIGR